MLASVASMIDQFNMPNICLLQRMGYEVYVACNFVQGNTCDAHSIRKLKKELHRRRVHLYQWDCPRDISSPAACYRAYRQLLYMTGRLSIAWIHCHSPVGGALARIAAHRKQIRVIYTAHGFHFYKGAPVRNWLLYYPAEKLLSYWTDVLITVNQEDYLFAKRNLRAGKVLRIPGVGIDIDKYSRFYSKINMDTEKSGQPFGQERERFCKKYQIPQDARILLSVGELSVRKNHRLAVQALAGLRRQNVYYLICGQGREKEGLQDYADSLGVGRYIRMPGYQENMPWVYQNADIFLLPSLQEGMPAALMEAMAAGLPCIVSDIRGNRELICDWRAANPVSAGEVLAEDLSSEEEGLTERCMGGMRYAPASLQELIDALEIMLDHEQLGRRCGRYNQEKIKDYSIARVQQRMEKIYRAVDRK